MRFFHRLFSNRHGQTAAEFALILPCLVMLTIGTINLCAMLYTYTSLHYAVEDSARCASVRPGTCSNSTTVNTYALTRYSGVTTDQNFVVSLKPCGYEVIGTATYAFSTGLVNLPVSMTAKACRAQAEN